MKRKFFSRYCVGFALLMTLGLTVSAREVEFPLLQSLSYFPYSDNSILSKGEFSGTVELYYSNIFSFTRELTILNDFEVFSATIAVRCGLWRGGTLELYYRQAMMLGGVMDRFIEDFHRTFHLPDDNRPEFPRNVVQYRYRDDFFYTGNQSAVSPLVLAFLKELYQTPVFSLKTRLALGLPLGKKPGFSSDKVFFSAGLIINYHKRRFSLELSNYLSMLKQPSWLTGGELRSSLFFSNLEANLGRFIWGFNFRTSAFKEDYIAHNAYQTYFGYKISRQLEFGFLEDFAPFDTTPDISVYLRVKLF
jgi:hypothetical protein